MRLDTMYTWREIRDLMRNKPDELKSYMTELKNTYFPYAKSDDIEGLMVNLMNAPRPVKNTFLAIRQWRRMLEAPRKQGEIVVGDTTYTLQMCACGTSGIIIEEDESSISFLCRDCSQPLTVLNTELTRSLLSEDGK